MRINIAIFIIFFFSKAYSQQDNLLETKEYWGNGKIKAITYSDGKYKQGICQYYDSLGKLTTEDRYINGNKYYLNLWQNGKQAIKNGNGELKEYYSNGILKAMGKIKEGKKYGKWTEYYINGKQQNQFNYEDWPLNYNSVIEFNLKLIASFDTLGNHIGRDGNGIVHITDYSGLTIKKVFYTNNRVDSCYSYYLNGNIHTIGYTNKTYNIEFTKKSYFLDGTKEFEETSAGDTIIQILWYNNGQIKEIKKSTKNKEYITEYNSNGEVTKVLDCTVNQYLNDLLQEISEYICKEQDLSHKRQE